MTPKYEREQAELQGQREKLAAEIAKSDKVYENIERFLPLIWKYTGITELTPKILNELIEKIVVHEKNSRVGRHQDPAGGYLLQIHRLHQPAVRRRLHWRGD